MAEESQSGGEKTEEASAKRRLDFRKKGQVAQSREAQTAALFSFMLLFWIFYAPWFWDRLTIMLTKIWADCGYAITPLSLMNLVSFTFTNMAILLVPMFIVSLFAGLVSTYIQIGWLFTGKPLMPDFNKLDPIKGAAKFVSKRSFLEFLKSVIKVILIAWVAYLTIKGQFDDALALIDMPIIKFIIFLGETIVIIMMKVSAIMIVIAVLDFLFVRWEMEEKMKMTKQEQKEEHKDAEGDPHIKSKIRAIQQQMAQKRMMASVPEADVIITNPTRIAVAIKYDGDKMEAPVVIAKGQNIIAAKIREIARENNIPLVENPPVARLLHSKVEPGQPIPEEMFKAIAEILAFIYSLKGNRGTRGQMTEDR
jgi:flagellar biosynthetic protein FlhB